MRCQYGSIYIYQMLWIFSVWHKWSDLYVYFVTKVVFHWLIKCYYFWALDISNILTINIASIGKEKWRRLRILPWEFDKSRELMHIRIRPKFLKDCFSAKMVRGLKSTRKTVVFIWGMANKLRKYIWSSISPQFEYKYGNSHSSVLRLVEGMKWSWTL